MRERAYRGAIACAAALLLMAPPGGPAGAAPAAEPPAATADTLAAGAAARLPVRFEKNLGQVDERVEYFARAGGATLFLTPEAAVFSVCRGADPAAPEAGDPGKRPVVRGAALFIRPVGSAAAPRLLAEGQLEGTTNYFRGDDESGWITEVPSFARVRYEQVYEGVDWVFYQGAGGLEYDFEVAAGVYPSLIRLRVEGADGMRVLEDGSMVFETAAGPVRQLAPVVFQEKGRRREMVPCRYWAAGDEFGFELDAYDPERPVTIDPILTYSTYLGGTYNEHLGSDTNPVAVDPAGNMYVGGMSMAANFPTTPGAFDRVGDGDAFVTKLAASGSSMVFSTYLGGTDGYTESVYGLDVDSSGNVYVVGGTFASDFPLRVPYMSNPDGSGWEDAFVTKLNPTGTGLVYSTYVGGYEHDRARAVKVDSAGAAYVTGYAGRGFPTTSGSFGQWFNDGVHDAFAAKLRPSGSQLVWSGLYGRTEPGTNYRFDDSGEAIALDMTNAVYVAGRTVRTYNGGTGFETGETSSPPRWATGDAFVTKINPAGSARQYTNILLNGEAYGIDVDDSGGACVAGQTRNQSFATTPGAYQTSYIGYSAAFVVRLTPSGGVLYSTAIGDRGPGVSTAYTAACDVEVTDEGSVYVVGFTNSAVLHTVDPIQPANAGGYDVYVARLNANGSELQFSSYFGGSGNDHGFSAALDGAGNLYIAGNTFSTNYPTAGQLQVDGDGGTYSDVFVTKFVRKSRAETPGVYRASDAAWFLRYTHSAGPADLQFVYGRAGTEWQALAGDWEGAGKSTPGLYDPANGMFYLRSANAPGPADLTVSFGPGGQGWLPVVGDWNGDGFDTPGLFDPTTAAFYLRDANAPGPADLEFAFGTPGSGWVPIAGDWDGDGLDTVGLYDPFKGMFYLRNANADGPADLVFSFGGAGLTPVAGDWDGDGVDTIGVYDTATAWWALRNSNSAGVADLWYEYGPVGVAPIVGDWDGE